MKNSKQICFSVVCSWALLLEGVLLGQGTSPGNDYDIMLNRTDFTASSVKMELSTQEYVATLAKKFGCSSDRILVVSVSDVDCFAVHAIMEGHSVLCLLFRDRIKQSGNQPWRRLKKVSAIRVSGEEKVFSDWPGFDEIIQVEFSVGGEVHEGGPSNLISRSATSFRITGVAYRIDPGIVKEPVTVSLVIPYKQGSKDDEVALSFPLPAPVVLDLKSKETGVSFIFQKKNREKSESQ